MRASTDDERRALLERSHTIAMVGASATPGRPSAEVFEVLHGLGRFAVTPINPAIDAVAGVRAYPTLAAYAAEHGAPDIVDVFRKPADAVSVVAEAAAVGAKAIWFQLGVASPEAIAAAEAAGLDIVAEHCIKIDNLHLLR